MTYMKYMIYLHWFHNKSYIFQDGYNIRLDRSPLDFEGLPTMFVSSVCVKICPGDSANMIGPHVSRKKNPVVFVTYWVVL